MLTKLCETQEQGPGYDFQLGHNGSQCKSATYLHYDIAEHRATLNKAIPNRDGHQNTMTVGMDLLASPNGQ